MDLVITILVRFLEVIFCAGMIGSAIVILMTLVEDAQVFLEPSPSEESYESRV
jgi:hypothetical protein